MELTRSGKTVQITPKIIDRFWPQVHKTSGCWEWRGMRDSRNRYGLFFVANGMTRISAHRFSWLIAGRSIPQGLYVCHHCDNTICVNPDHLFVGTQKDNMQDCVQKGRMANRPAESYPHGERHYNARLTGAAVNAIRQRYAQGGVTYQDLGSIYGVTPTNIGAIVRGQTWQAREQEAPQ